MKNALGLLLLPLLFLGCDEVPTTAELLESISGQTYTTTWTTTLEGARQIEITTLEPVTLDEEGQVLPFSLVIDGALAGNGYLPTKLFHWQNRRVVQAPAINEDFPPIPINGKDHVLSALHFVAQRNGGHTLESIAFRRPESTSTYYLYFSTPLPEDAPVKWIDPGPITRIP